MTSAAGPGIATRVLGARVKRLEDPRLLTGQGRYLDDIRLPGLLHAAFVRSPHAHARLSGVDASAALEVPGVVAVLAGARPGRPGPSRSRPGSRARASPRPRGPPWPSPACASSASRWPWWRPGRPTRPRTAASASPPRYEPLPALADVDAALAPGAPVLHETAPGNVLLRRRFSQGDVDGAFARAAVRIRERFGHGRCSAAPLEPRGDRRPLGGRSAHDLDRDPDPVRLSHRAGPGLRAPGEPRAGDRARHGRRLRPEDARDARGHRRGRAGAGRRPARQVDGDAARELRGRLARARGARWSWRRRPTPTACCSGFARASSPTPAPITSIPLTQALEPLGTAAILPGPYRTPAYAYECVAVATNKPPLGAYRGVGMAFAAFAMERTLDLLADRLGLDPAEIRRRNLIPRDAYPFASAGGFVYDSGDLPAALEQALELAGYERLTRERDEAPRARPAPGRRHRLLHGVHRHGLGDLPPPRDGRGAGTRGGAGRDAADASVSCFVSFPSQGQGHETTIAQLVAAELGVPPDRVHVRPVDTEASPAGTGTFASRGAIAQTGTVQRAAAAVRAKLLALAAGVLEAHEADLELRDGRVTVRGVPERGVTVAELARLAHAPPAGGLPGGPSRRASRPPSPSTRRAPRSRGPSTWPRSRWTPTPAGSRCATTPWSRTAGP